MLAAPDPHHAHALSVQVVDDAKRRMDALQLKRRPPALCDLSIPHKGGAFCWKHLLAAACVVAVC